ncbi:MAG: lysophospholipid acyltransferase family protein [Elusimicrobiota bacterium]
MNELFYENSPLHPLLSALAWLYVHFIALTSRISIKGDGFPIGPGIYAIWHRQEVLLIYLQRNRGLCGLISKSRDGEYMARILLRFGFSFVRGSTTSGGFLSLRALIKAARSGASLAITPDGPHGPVFKVQPGAIYLAQKTGIPVIPCACALSKKKILRSWDKYQFPLPFGRIQTVYGAPFYVAETDDIPSKATELEGVLNDLTAEAEKLLTGGCRRSSKD